MGAFPAAINNEGQTPAELAEEHVSTSDNQIALEYNRIVELLATEIERLSELCVCVCSLCTHPSPHQMSMLMKSGVRRRR